MLKEVDGVWLPKTEEHMLRFAGSRDWDYQQHKLDAAMRWVRGRYTAVDVGAHCGLWSRRLVRLFAKTYAFEPVRLHRKAFQKNVIGNYKLFPFACGDKNGNLKLKTVEQSTGDTHASEDGNLDAVMVRIDDVLNVKADFLKIDTEGFEEFVLKGAERLLESKPCVIVEQKPNKAKHYGLDDTGAVKFLQSKGAILREVIAGDYILSWNE